MFELTWRCASLTSTTQPFYRFRALHDCLVTPASPAMRISLTSIRRTVRDTKLPIDSRRSSMYSASSILKSPRRPGPNFIGHIRSRRINGVGKNLTIRPARTRISELAIRALVRAGPRPGLSSSRWLVSSDRCQAVITRSNFRIDPRSIRSWAPARSRCRSTLE